MKKLIQKSLLSFSLVVTPPLLRAPTVGSAPPLKISRGWGSYDPSEGRFFTICHLTFSLIVTLAVLTFLSDFSSAAEIKTVTAKKDDKCPVCGMFVAKYTHWLSEVVFKDGTYAVFDGPKDMFKYFLNLQKYAPAKKLADITGIYVTEYYSTTLLDARKLFFVIGSDVYGPMGDEFVPLSSEGDAREFMRDHKGTRIVKFQEVTNEFLH